MDYAERLADALLDKPDVVAVGQADPDGLRPSATRCLARHNTVDMLSTEAAAASMPRSQIVLVAMSMVP